VSSRKITGSIIAGAAVIAVAGASYGIVSATSSSTPAAASSGSAEELGEAADDHHCAADQVADEQPERVVSRADERAVQGIALIDLDRSES
jgi:hypothetical protein